MIQSIPSAMDRMIARVAKPAKLHTSRGVGSNIGLFGGKVDLVTLYFNFGRSGAIAIAADR